MSVDRLERAAKYKLALQKIDEAAALVKGIGQMGPEAQEAYDEAKKSLATKMGRELGPAGGTDDADRDPKRERNERKAFEGFMRTGDDTELKGMILGNDPVGGYTVVTELAADIARVALLFSPMRKLAKVTNVARADYRRLISTSGAEAEWRAELETRSETNTPPLAAIAPPSGEISSVVGITRWLLNDSNYDLAAFVTEETGKAHGVSEGAAFMTGSGINRPSGILTQASAVQRDDVRPFFTLEEVHSTTDGSVKGPDGSQADPLIDLLYRLKPQYRTNASWLMHPTAIAQVRSLKDKNGQLLWQPTIQVGQPPSFLGAPVYEDPNLEAPASGSRSIIVGDFRAGYEIINIGSPVMIRDDVTQKGRVLFEIARRVGGAVIDSNALKVFRLAA